MFICANILLNLTRIQAIDLFFSMKVHGLTEYKLTNVDWELLDALYAVLAVSFYPDSDSSADRSTRCTGSSYGSTNYVGRIDASTLRSCSILRNFHDLMGKTPYQVPRVETVGRHRLRVGYKVLHMHGRHRCVCGCDV